MLIRFEPPNIETFCEPFKWNEARLKIFGNSNHVHCAGIHQMGLVDFVERMAYKNVSWLRNK